MDDMRSALLTLTTRVISPLAIFLNTLAISVFSVVSPRSRLRRMPMWVDVEIERSCPRVMCIAAISCFTPSIAVLPLVAYEYERPETKPLEIG